MILRIFAIVYVVGILAFSTGVFATYPAEADRRDAAHILVELACILAWPAFAVFVLVLQMTERKR